MNKQLQIATAAFAILSAVYAGSVAAQDSATIRTIYVSDRGDTIHCDTQDQTTSCGHVHKWKFHMFHRADAGLVRCVATGNSRTYCGKSDVPFVAEEGRNSVCVEGSTWGMDDGNLWVSGRCSAFFPREQRSTVARD